jgi:hypothetical protein
VLSMLDKFLKIYSKRSATKKISSGIQLYDRRLFSGNPPMTAEDMDSWGVKLFFLTYLQICWIIIVKQITRCK